MTIKDIIYSVRGGIWKVLIWNVPDHKFLICELEEFHESSPFHKRKISPEEGNKYTFEKGCDCKTHQYFLWNNV